MEALASQCQPSTSSPAATTLHNPNSLPELAMRLTSELASRTNNNESEDEPNRNSAAGSTQPSNMENTPAPTSQTALQMSNKENDARGQPSLRISLGEITLARGTMAIDETHW
ncbi:hypothetical protein P175DRAFT_0215870 [Aspergillus ochraceoroseus IBT 24754]|uniref:Uncharacterized protein n=1 Tax=Aspergillus ochraceoroseus IBT 24754 TaxID=1392256 RepID=A0A2T5M0Y8_9EURO|nr:uncharacterized protein P175DRAFT_0215870 [Aspergillus ochraceoroseus IBT 24754]PTU22202.1 hypothetical protein P175DRAFT_0215870 [Aspergillus ochraceoroseus IBT 24754]